MDLVSALVSEGVLEPVQARLIRQRQGALGGALADHLLEMGLLSFQDLQATMARCTDQIPLGELELDLAERAAHRFLSPKLAQRYRAVPICLIGRRLIIATSEPSQAQTLFDSLRSAHQVHPELRVAAPFLVESLLGWLYGLPPSAMAQGLCLRLTPRFYRLSPPLHHPGQENAIGAPKTERRRYEASGLGNLMERLRELDEARHWLGELRKELAVWSPEVELSRNRPRGLRESAFLAPLPDPDRPLFWLSCQGSGRRLDRVRRLRLESLVELLRPEVGRIMGLR